MNKKIVASLLGAILVTSSSTYGASLPVTQPMVNLEVPSDTGKQVEEAKELTLDAAIETGLKNSILLQQVKNQVDLAKLISSNSSNTKTDLNNAESDLRSAGYSIDDGRDKIYASEAQLSSGQAALDQGIAPIDIPVPQLGPTAVIPAGQNIVECLKKLGVPEAMVPTVAEQIKQGAQQAMDGKTGKLNSSKKNLEESTQEYLSSRSKYEATLQFAMAGVANKLSTSTITSLKPAPLADLIVKMATAQDEVTSYSTNIYKNQVALIIENSYFEALKQQKLLAVKDKAVERGAMQYELAKAAYEVGAKSKDDMLLAKSYYDSTVMMQEIQLKDYTSALISLKKNINIKLDEEVKLVPVEASVSEAYDLTQGITSGLKTRLEIKKAETQSKLYEDLLTAVKESDYTSSDNQYKEVQLLQEKSQIELRSAKLQVESDIRTSYATMMSMQKVVETAKGLRESAKENVEIAKVKYEVGYGYDNALLKQLNLQDMSGTVVEVIAAEENLANVEAKEIEAINGYNLARLKYLNDVGILPYK
ncbi:MAG: TolC family protein [Cellulosilyticaceae bacterium]